MPRIRRFRIDSLENATPGATLTLGADESRHARVLRLDAGAEIELFDGLGRSARAMISEISAATVSAVLSSSVEHGALGPRLTLATAWPKGKRAAVLVEKCSELGVTEILPVLFKRSVVTKDAESEGMARLRRIAAEAAKQSGRVDVPEISSEITFEQLVERAGQYDAAFLLSPRAPARFSEVLAEIFDRSPQSSPPQLPNLLVLIGPEGGITDDEEALANKYHIRSVRLARHVLRVETAALSAAAVVAEAFA